MKYTKDSGTFTTKEFSLDETIQETMDVIDIAIAVLKADGNIDLAIINLKQAQTDLEHIRRKTKIALQYVPQNVQEKEYL